jgi:hypothetical protein
LIDIGRDLQAAKKHLLNHGEFIKWVESELGIVQRTAQAYMAVARLMDERGATIALLPPTTAHRLAAKSTPSEIVSEVVARAQTGDVLPDRKVSEMILEAKSQKRRNGQPEGNHSAGFKQYENCRGLQEDRKREKKTSEMADMLFKSLGAESVALVIKAFGEEEWPWDLLHELRKRMLLRKKAVHESHPSTINGSTTHPYRP